MGKMMHEKEIKQKVVVALSEEFEIEQEKLKPEATLYEDLGFDSLDAIDMVVVLEKTFGVKLSDESAIRSVRTVGDIFDLIIKLRKEYSEKE
jgi:acyl carrier protein